jgi:hypothetical protein
MSLASPYIFFDSLQYLVQTLVFHAHAANEYQLHCVP